ncbi:post-GPI attachment to proteins factor 2-like isoform X1 [Paramormyrops kingsleyae]|uniref:post-GPI attachment to proteins factor 2 isoform X1 n=1 Tax=Paramormyrops kingsleyae TaxID=1676925 RepID=UPI003B97976E
MLQGPYASDRDKVLIRFPFHLFAVGTVFLALGGLISCVLISVFYNYSDATNTHCKVPNYLPSISASISLAPERYIWRICIGLHSAPRILLAVAYFNLYRIHFAKRCLEWCLALVALACVLAENLGLLLLTYVSSTETYNLHRDGFVMFISCSLVHMLITCWLWRVIDRYSLTAEEGTSRYWKLRLLLSSLIACVCAAYFYWRHNKYCEAGVYTWFAFSEYMIVLFNMAFHTTAYWDFRGKEMVIATVPEDKRF